MTGKLTSLFVSYSYQGISLDMTARSDIEGDVCEHGWISLVSVLHQPDFVFRQILEMRHTCTCQRSITTNFLGLKVTVDQTALFLAFHRKKCAA